MHVNEFVTYLFVGYHINVSNVDDDDDECTVHVESVRASCAHLSNAPLV